MTIGIYCIKNTNNGKRYIGKSKNIEKRFKAHTTNLISKVFISKSTNRFLWNSVQKYGIASFSFEILEIHSTLDEDYMSDRELYFMDLYNSCDRKFGYNLRRDSSTKSTVHPETLKYLSEINKGDKNSNYGNKWTDDQRQRMSSIKKEQFKDGMYDWMKTKEWSKAQSERSVNLWKDKDKLKTMSKKVAIINSTLRFYQYDKKTMELVKVWESMNEILTEHEDYHRIAIYSVCNGHKKSYRGFVWTSKLK